MLEITKDEIEIQECMCWNTSYDFIYSKGKIIYPDSYNDDIRIECTNGIHFFITKKEAKEWN